MSTKAIREALEAFRKTGAPLDTRYVLIMKALDEVVAIEKAAREWVEDKPGVDSHAVLERIAEESAASVAGGVRSE